VSSDQRIDYSLNQIYFYLTAACNLRCRHCWIVPRFQDHGTVQSALEFDLFRSIVDQAGKLGLSGVKLTGGEPLIHPRIGDIIERIREAGLTLGIETNGVSLTPQLARAIRECKNAFVSVSLDGADAETHEWMRGLDGCWREAIQGVRYLVEAGLRPQIIMSLVRRNKDQVEAVVGLAESLGAESVKFNIVQPTARGQNMRGAGETLSIEELVEMGRWVETDLSHSTNLRLVFSHPPVFRPLSRLLGPAGDGCSSCGIFGILGVLADGSYALCGIGETVPELVFGSALTDSLEEVWRESAVLNDIRRGLPARLTGTCRRCLLKKLCLGECIAQNYYRTKDLWSSYWYCEEAYAAGLFPKSRIGIANMSDSV